MFMNLHFPHLLDFYEKTLSKRKKIVFGLPWWPTFFQELGPQTITLLLCGKWCRSFFIFHSLFEMVAKRKYILYIMDYSRKKNKAGRVVGLRRGGGEDILFWTTLPLEGFLLCPRKFQTKQGFTLENPQNWAFQKKKNSRVFQIVVRGGWGWGGGWGSEILIGEIFLPGEGNLRRSDFDNSNLFQS